MGRSSVPVLLRALRRSRSAARRVRLHDAVRMLQKRNSRATQSIVGESEVAVSLTSYGSRLETAHITIESIASGTVLPKRVMLWLDGPEHDLPETLLRLRDRGLEIAWRDRIGPYQKYHRYLEEHASDGLDLVTADDDILYPRNWLRDLVDAAHRQPNVVVGHRLRRMTRVSDGTLTAYASWPEVWTRRASVDHFVTGVSGVLYPPVAQAQLISAGGGFRDVAPTADDVWISLALMTSGISKAQVRSYSQHFPIVPGTQASALMALNVGDGANDSQILTASQHFGA